MLIKTQQFYFPTLRKYSFKAMSMLLEIKISLSTESFIYLLISCVSPSSVVALVVAGSPHCYLPVTTSPEAGESADVAVRGSWICFSGISEGSLHKGTEKEDRMQTHTHKHTHLKYIMSTGR